MNEEKNIFNKIIEFIILVILLVILYLAYQYYQKNNFNDFVRSETNPHVSVFIRDDEIKYSENSSYKIESSTYNDAMFYKKIKVEKNKPYKVTCMVKTNDIKSKEEKSGVGAQISIEGTTERSIAILLSVVPSIEICAPTPDFSSFDFISFVFTIHVTLYGLFFSTFIFL